MFPRALPKPSRPIRAALLLLLLAAPMLPAGEPPRPEPDPAATLQFELAQKLRTEKLLKTATAEYAKFLQQYPKDPRRPAGLFWLADCHFQLAHFAKAAIPYDAFCRDYPAEKQIPWALLNLGRCLIHTEQYPEAIAALERLEKLPPPEELAAHTAFYLGEALCKKGSYAEARKRFDAVVEMPTADAAYRSLAMFWGGDIRQRARQFQEAIQVYGRHLNEFPGLPLNADVRLRLGECHQQLKQFDKAAAFFALIEKDKRFAARALYNRAQSLYQLKKYAEAIVPAERLLATVPNDANSQNTLLLLGRCRFELKQYEQAARMFQGLVETFPKAPAAQNALLRTCLCYYNLGEKFNPQRMKACQDYLARYPGSSEAGEVRYLLGDVCAAVGRLDTALANFQAVPKESQYYSQARFRTALTQHQLRNLPAAGAAYDALVAELPKHPRADFAMEQSVLIHYYLAGAAKTAGQRTELYAGTEQRAASFLSRYATHGKAGEVLFIKGQSQRMQSKYDEMAASFGQYVQLEKAPKAATATFWIAQNHQRQGDRARLLAQARIDQHKTAEARKLLEQSSACHDRAVAAYRKVIGQAVPEAGEARFRLAQSYYATGAARASSAQYLAADGAQAEAATAQKLSDACLDAAAETYAQVIAKTPDLVKDDRTYRWTASRFRARSKPDRAIETYSGLLERWPKTASRDSVLCQLGLLHAELAKPDWAASLRYYDQLLAEYAATAQADPGRPGKFEWPARFGRALALKNTGKTDEAARLFEDVIGGVPPGDELNVRSTIELGECHFLKAQALHAGGDRAGALKKYAEALSLFVKIGMLYEDPEFTPRSLYWSGRCTVARNDLDEATRLWRRLLARYPQSPWAAKARAELKQRGIVVESKPAP